MPVCIACCFERRLFLFKDGFSTLANFGVCLLSSVVLFDAILINFKAFFHINWTGEHWSKHSNGSKLFICRPECAHSLTMWPVRISIEVCTSLYNLLEPSTAEALPCNYTSQSQGFAQQLISQDIFCLLSTEQVLTKGGDATLASKAIPISTSTRYQIMQNKNHTCC